MEEGWGGGLRNEWASVLDNSGVQGPVDIGLKNIYVIIEQKRPTT